MMITKHKQIDILLKEFESIQSWFDKYDGGGNYTRYGVEKGMTIIGKGLIYF